MNDWQNIAPKIYLDSCVLMDAIIDRGNIKTTDKLRLEIPIAKCIFENWPKQNLFISPFVIGEIMQLGKKYGKNEDEMTRIVINQVLPKVHVIYAEEKDLAPIAKLYEAIGVESRIAFDIEFKGVAIDQEGIHHDDALRMHKVLFNGVFLDSIFEGLPLDAEMLAPDARLRNTKVERVSAPVFELALFHRLAQIVHGTDVKWTDAFHFYYAQKAYCWRILTNDRRMIGLKNLPKHWPKPISPSQFKHEISQCSLGSIEFMNDIFKEPLHRN